MARANRSHTKSGPGRYHGQGTLANVSSNPAQPKFINLGSSQRLPVAAHGGNWKGKEYLSYREHDQEMRYAMAAYKATRTH